MKINVICMFFIIFFMIGACQKKQNEQLATTYFKMALAEIAESSDKNIGYKQALIVIDKALEIVDKAEYFAFKGTILFKLKHYSQSEEAFNKALIKTNDCSLKAEINNNLACLWAQIGQANKSVIVWEKLKSDIFYKTPEVALVNLGKLYIDQGLFNKADSVLYEATLLVPSYLDAHFYRALIAQHEGNKKLLEYELKTVLTLDPKHPGAQYLSKM